MNSNEVNNAFTRESNVLANNLSKILTKLGPVSTNILVDRTVQKFLEIGRLPYARLALKDQLFANTLIDLKCCKYDLSTGNLTLSMNQWILGLVEFFIHWLFCLFALLAVKFNSCKQASAVLVYGVSDDVAFQNGNDQVFSSYCNSTPITPLQKENKLFVQSSIQTDSSTDCRIIYIKRPLIELIRNGKLGFFGRTRAIIFHFCTLLEFTLYALRLPKILLLGRDYAYVRIALELDNAELIKAVVMTCSNVPEQQLWCRCLINAKVHMIWYAQNWRPVVYADNGIESDIPFLKWIRVNEHWVWTNKFAKYLKNLTGTNSINAIGPIIWQSMQIAEHDKNFFQIIVFDMSPYDDDTAISYCECPNYNNPDNVKKFIQDIVSLKSKLEKKIEKSIILRIKTKRGYQKAYDKKYFELLDDLNSSKKIILELHSSNVYELISSCDIVIAYPFTSPPYLANELNVHSIYYDPTGSILNHNFSDPNSLITFASCKEELHNQVLNYYVGKNFDLNFGQTTNL